MPGTVTVIRDASNGREFMNDSGYRMYLYSESGRYSFGVDVAPRKIQYDDLALDWAQAERSGTTPLLLQKGVPLDTIQFEFMILDKLDMLAPQGSRVSQLREMARLGERVLVRYSSAEVGLWRVTDASMSSELRSPDGDEITRATVSVTLTRASDAAPAVGPVLRPPPPPPPPPNPPPPRTYVVVKGDCLWDIARKFYGANAGPSWPRIYDANRGQIKDPHWIYPGQRFVIP